MNKPSKPSKSDIFCNCLKLRRASQVITKVYDKFLEPSGIKITQYLLIKTISRLQPVNVSDLAAYVHLDRTTLVRNLKPLEQRGLILDVAKSSARDRQLTLSESGKEVLTQATSLWRQAQAYIEQYMGAEDLSTLSSLLFRIHQLDV